MALHMKMLQYCSIAIKKERDNPFGLDDFWCGQIRNKLAGFKELIKMAPLVEFKVLTKSLEKMIPLVEIIQWEQAD
jgi:hypothetical protein